MKISGKNDGVIPVNYSECPAIREHFSGFLPGIEIVERRRRYGVMSAIPQVFTLRRSEREKLKALDESLADRSVDVQGLAL